MRKVFSPESFHELYDGVVEHSVVDEALEMMKRGIDGKYRYDTDVFEQIIDGAHASISMHPGDGIETFKCDCGYSGEGLCRHFVFLTDTASRVVAKLATEDVPKTSVSSLELKLAKSSDIPVSLKDAFRKFSKEFPKIWSAYLGSPDKTTARQNEIKAYDTRNAILDMVLDLAYSARKEKHYLAALKVLLFGLSQFYKTMDYNNENMLMAVHMHIGKQLRTLVRVAKAAEKKEIWDFVTNSLLIKNVDKLPQLPVLEFITDFLLEAFDSRKYLVANLELLNKLTDLASSAGKDELVRHWIINRLWLLGQSDMPEEELYQECLNWWHIVPVRLNYLEHCMSTHNYLTAFTIAKECLSSLKETDDESLTCLHRLLLGSSYKIGKYDTTIREANWLADYSPETLFFDLHPFMSADKTRWPKIVAKMRPILKRATGRMRAAV